MSSPDRSLNEVPILLLDISGFSQLPDRDTRVAALRQLQQVLNESGRFFDPYGDIWAKWTRHGTGDGYYIVLDALPPQVAAEYALSIRDGVSGLSEGARRDLDLRLRIVLAFGDVRWVEDQIVSDPFTVAQRFIDFEPFKRLVAGPGSPCAIAATALFKGALDRDLHGGCKFERLGHQPWTPVQIRDKHGNVHKGYVLGDGWEEQTAVPGDAPSKPLRVTVLIGHSLHDPLPEAVELAMAAARDFQSSSLNVELRVDVASMASLVREAQRGCDLLVYYGHGSEDGYLSFTDGRRSCGQLVALPGLKGFWPQLTACFVFACYGDRFAAGLPCPWIAFSGPVMKVAPKVFLHSLVQGLGTLDLRQAASYAMAQLQGADHGQR